MLLKPGDFFSSGVTILLVFLATCFSIPLRLLNPKRSPCPTPELQTVLVDAGGCKHVVRALFELKNLQVERDGSLGCSSWCS